MCQHEFSDWCYDVNQFFIIRYCSKCGYLEVGIENPDDENQILIIKETMRVRLMNEYRKMFATNRDSFLKAQSEHNTILMTMLIEGFQKDKESFLERVMVYSTFMEE